MIAQQTVDILNFYHDKYNRKDFIEHDPVSIPHRYTKKQDIEISGLFAATLAWGNRTSIINSCNKLLAFMDNQPHEFILQHSSKDLKPFTSFVHRTFNATDVLYFIEFLKQHYTMNDSMENLFIGNDAEQGLTNFHNSFFFAGKCTAQNKKTCVHTCKKVDVQTTKYVFKMDVQKR